jgi:hypothetical protein
MQFQGSFHSLGLKRTFFFDISFPTVYACLAVFKYFPISLFPDMPSCNDEYFHEEMMVEILPSKLHHLKERGIQLPLDSYGLPAFQGKGTAEKKVKSSFFSLS